MYWPALVTRVLFKGALLPIVTCSTRMEWRRSLGSVTNAVEHVLRRPSPLACLVERFGEAIDYIVRHALVDDEIEAGIGDREARLGIRQAAHEVGRDRRDRGVIL